MSKLSKRMDELKSRGGRAPSPRQGIGGTTPDQPVNEEPGWVPTPLVDPNPPSPLQNALFLAFAAALVVLLNALFWGRGSDGPAIDPVSGRQINESEPWK